MGCVEDAINVYIRRAKTDTNSRVVRMVLPHAGVEDHWYYKSDQVISTSDFLILDEAGETRIGPFEGPVSSMEPRQRKFFLDDCCETAREETYLGKRAVKLGIPSYRELIRYSIAV